MKKHILPAVLAMALMILPAAHAETISLSGTVKPAEETVAYASAGGTIESVYVTAGQKVSKGDPLLKLATEKVYASQSGTITGVFAQAGDDADTATDTYGGVMYMEGDVRFTLSASTSNAYKSAATKYVHIGESVYLVNTSDSTLTGTGVITAVSGTSYTVEVTEGNFTPSEKYDIYREESHVSTSRIGRGTVSRTDPVAVTGSGTIVSMAVKDGDYVEAGQLLFETLTGTANSGETPSATLYAEADGIVETVNVSTGNTLSKGDAVATICKTDKLCMEAEINEADLAYLSVGDTVDMTFTWNEEATATGRVSAIAYTATEDASSVTYTVHIDFVPDENTRLGMTATIDTKE